MARAWQHGSWAGIITAAIVGWWRNRK
ncbi:type I toxin-antitoxin system toxin Ldr family protein [Escherichia coli]